MAERSKWNAIWPINQMAQERPDMRIVVIGAGAIVSYLAASLARGGCKVALIARGERLVWLRSHPIEIASSSETTRIPVLDWPEIAQTVDLAFICTKTTALPEALQAIGGNLAPAGVIVTVQNGVDALAGAGIGIEMSPDIARDFWQKLMLAAFLGGLGAAWDMDVGGIFEAVNGEQNLRGAMHEVVALAGAIIRMADAEGIQVPLFTEFDQLIRLNYQAWE